jgi:8-hydroxy-5-deazaflavin:NADPH oxidoreductase
VKGADFVAKFNQALKGPTLECRENEQAANAADMVILAVPYSARTAMINAIRKSLNGKILIDATVPLVPPKVNRVQLPTGGSAVANVQAALGEGVLVVAAFQNVSAHRLLELGSDVDCDVLVCGDDAHVRQ